MYLLYKCCGVTLTRNSQSCCVFSCIKSVSSLNQTQCRTLPPVSCS